MTQDEVIVLMESCQTADDWRTRCDYVKAQHDGGYPDFWYDAIIRSGLGDRVAARWGSDMTIRAYDATTGKEIRH